LLLILHDEIEKDFTLQGITAIEDMIADGVANAI
jgi:magnesium-transporting ATPase (P-type)